MSDVTENSVDEKPSAKIMRLKDEIIGYATELSHPKVLGQREYIEWEGTVRDKLRVAVFKLEKLQASKKGKA